jgi:hypothetical protein
MTSTSDSVVVCEVCGKKMPSEEKDKHLLEEHGIEI